MDTKRISEIEERLRGLNVERRALEAELEALRAASKRERRPAESPTLGIPSADTAPVTFAEQVALFLTLFRCRESVYPLLWENRSKGTIGYSPACDNEWVRGTCGKPPHGKVKCSECANQSFRPLDEKAVEAHLRGVATIGTYAIREDDTCVFLACDFDGEGWSTEALLYQSVAAGIGIDVLVERSRSGAGAHSWIFFAEPVQAHLARALGTIVLAKCTDIDCRFGFGSFDRFFPSQDLLPKGGFGNLIALPMQRIPAECGNSVFIDRDLKPVRDQWDLLASTRRLSVAEVNHVLGRHSPKTPHATVSCTDMSLATDSAILGARQDLHAVLPDGFSISIKVGAQVTIPLAGLPALLIAVLRKTATFANPEFYKLQRMRMATYPHPRVIFAGELRFDELAVPRGVLDRATEILRKAGATVHVLDERDPGRPMVTRFLGILAAAQEEAVSAVEARDQGVLVAPPGSGKTVIACAAIARRGVSTLILVHKQPLADQWQEQVTSLLGIPKKEVGVFGGSKKHLHGQVDVAMLQTLARAEDVEQIVAGYGQLIIDECHHVPAVSFEAVMKRCAPKFILGLTATPDRKDGLERLLYFQCGPILHTVAADHAAALLKKASIRETGFKIPDHLGPNPPYHLVAELIASDGDRNGLIVSDIVSALELGRFPLVIADRKSQISQLIELIGRPSVPGAGSSVTPKVFSIDGGVSPKMRRETLARMSEARGQGDACVLFSTSSLIGEGVDLPELDTLVLASPLSFEGRLVQYAGRLHRVVEGKVDVIVMDYIDSSWAVSLSMYRNRLRAYRKMGYEVEGPGDLLGGLSGMQRSLFS